MSNFKQTAEKWAEDVLAKQPSAEEVEKTNRQLQELAILGRLYYNDKGNWIPQLNLN